MAEYLRAVANGARTPIATEDDPRWTTLDEADWDDEDDDEDEDWEADEEDEDEVPVKKLRSPKRPPSATRGSPSKLGRQD